MPGIQPTVEIVVRRWVMPISGSALARREHRVEVQHRLAHAHEHAVVDRLRCDGSEAPGRGSPRRSGCARSASPRSRRTCTSAGSPTARRRRSSAARRGSASAPPPADARRRWRTAPSPCRRWSAPPRAASRLENGSSRSELLAQRRREVGHLAVAVHATRRPRPHLAGAKARLAARGEQSDRAGAGPCLEGRRRGRLLWLQQMRILRGPPCG